VTVSAAAPLDSIRAVGVDLYYEGAYPEARAYLEEASRRAVLADDTAAWSDALLWLGFVARMQLDYGEATRLGERALELERLAGLDDQVWRALNLLGLVAWEQSRLEEAAELFARVIDEAERSGQARGLAVAAGNRGLVYEALGEFELARSGFHTMREGGLALSDTLLVANALTNLGMLAVRTGDVENAIANLEAAIPLQLVVNAYGAENTIGQLGTAYALAGDLGKAHVQLDSAMSLARSLGMRGEEGENQRMLGDLYREAGDWPRALRTYAVARSILEEAGWRVEAGAALRSEAEVLAAQGDLDNARDRAALALELHENAGALPESLRDLLALAEIDARDGRTEEAAGRLDDATWLAERVGAPRERTYVALSKARIADAAGDPGRILAVLPPDEDLERWGTDARWEGHMLRASALAREGRLGEAIHAGRRAVSAVERVRGSLGSGILRTSYAASRQRVYGELVLTLLAAGRDAEALEISDAARGRVAVEHMAVAGGASRSWADGRLLGERERLLRRIDVLLDSVNASPDAQPARRRSLEEARLEYEAFRMRNAERSTEDVSPSSAVSLDAIRAALLPTEALLEYLVTPDTVVAFVLRRSGLTVTRSTIRTENLASRIRLARELMTSPEGSARSPPGILEGLFGVLIQPSLETGALDDIDRLLIVPHGVLAYLPFSALRDPRTGEYLIERFTIAALPNGSLLPALRERAEGSRTDRGSAFAPFPERLPASRAEVEAIGRRLAGSPPLVGREASEASVRNALGRRGVVHLATHGVMNARSPLFSRVELAPGAGTSSDDGRLEVHELLEMVVTADVVFLSGCETALGPAGATRFEQGEDFATLAESFLVAGAGDVVATLWRVEDASAAMLAGLFYDALGGAGPAVAIAEAQRAMIARPELSEPFRWAAYVVTGAGRASD
jgi:CHAT domain-containing protein/tetratricopeptide (TPR) repeat protein